MQNITFDSSMNVHFGIEDGFLISNAVITIGSFDGVHKGHKTLLNRLNHLADQLNGESVLISFEPHPRIALQKDINGFKLLSLIEEKIQLLISTGLDHLVIVPFNQDFAGLDPNEYLTEFIQKNFDPKGIVIGYDHRYGRGRTGDIDLLKRHFNHTNTIVDEIDPIFIRDLNISSSKIRTMIDIGDIKQANELLDHQYLVSGQVIHGDHIGQTLGYPTANMDIDFEIKAMPPDGVYAVTSKIHGRMVDGMGYIGRRPVLGKDLALVFEVHFFDLNENLYDETLFVNFHSKIRSEKQLTSLEELKTQLDIDARSVKDFFRMNNVKS